MKIKTDQTIVRKVIVGTPVSSVSNYVRIDSAGVKTIVDSAIGVITGTGSDPIVTENSITGIIDSNYVQDRQIDFFRDSAFVTGIVNDVYIQARDRFRDSLEFMDSAEVIALIDSAYVQARQDNPFTRLRESDGEIVISGNFIPDSENVSLGSPTKPFKELYLSTNTVFLGQNRLSVDSDLDFKIQTSTGDIANIVVDHVHFGLQKNDLRLDSNGQLIFADKTLSTNLGFNLKGNTLGDLSGIDLTGLDSNKFLRFNGTDWEVVAVDSAYIQARQNYLDSQTISDFIDSAYIQLRDRFRDSLEFMDSAEVIDLVDSQYIYDRINDLFLDSAEAIQLIDSAYVQERQYTFRNFREDSPGHAGGAPFGDGVLRLNNHIVPENGATTYIGHPQSKITGVFARYGFFDQSTVFLGDLALSADDDNNLKIGKVEFDAFGFPILPAFDPEVPPIIPTKAVVTVDPTVTNEFDLFKIIDSNYIDSVAGERIKFDIDTNYIDERVGHLYMDSVEVYHMVDSAYIQARQVDFFRDSAFVTNIVDTVYIQARDRLRDSEFVTEIVDEAYIQARDRYRDSAFVTQILTSNVDVSVGTPTDNSFDDGAIGAQHTDKLETGMSVADGLDHLNEVILNVHENTYVKSIEFTASPIKSGVGGTITLTLEAQGNANEYDIDWGDGTVDTGITTLSPSHVYTDNLNSPYTVKVVARNNQGSGAGSVVELEKQSYIIIFTEDPVVDFDLYRSNTGGSPLTGNNLYVIEGNSVSLENTTTNSDNASVLYLVNWNDGTVESITSPNDVGGTTGSRLEHTYAIGTGGSTYDIDLQLDSHSTANPDIFPLSITKQLKVYAATPGEPRGLSTKSITLDFSSEGSSPKLAAGFLDNISTSTTLVAGDDVTRTTENSLIGTNTTSSFAYNADSGELSAIVNGVVDGTISLNSSDNTGNDLSLTITEERDYNLLDSDGSEVTFANSIFYPNAFKGFKAKVSASNMPTGTNSFQLSHSVTGNTNTLEFVKDDLIDPPTVVNGGTLTESVSGNYRYISGIPYYNTGNPKLAISGTEVLDFVGQCFTGESPIVIANDLNHEGTVQGSISTQTYTYADVDGQTSMLDSGIPVANTGVGSSYALGSFEIDITSSPVISIENLNISAKNLNGTSQSVSLPQKIQVHTSPQSAISEISIPVRSSLGSVFSDNGVRIFDFSAETSDNPTYLSSTNFYTNNPYTEISDPGVEGTKEATVRLGKIEHNVEDYSNGFLPVGPNRSGDTGTQYFTFAFRRNTVASFNIDIVSSGISGLWIAAPGTGIDTSSTLNGWLDCSVQYSGIGQPGADTGNNGNGSNGCASTGADVIPQNTSLNGSYKMTLGSENLSNATGGVALVRIALAAGQSVTSLEIS